MEIAFPLFQRFEESGKINAASVPSVALPLFRLGARAAVAANTSHFMSFIISQRHILSDTNFEISHEVQMKSFLFNFETLFQFLSAKRLKEAICMEKP
jgi:hypothetical protein